MFLIDTRVGPSAIHGVGVFALEPVAAGAIVWRYEPAFDRRIEPGELAGLPRRSAPTSGRYAYPSADLGGALVLSCDHAKFLNHSEAPNTVERRSNRWRRATSRPAKRSPATTARSAPAGPGSTSPANRALTMPTA